MFVAVASGKGGTGKTLVATSLALAAGKCTYIDLDVEEPNGSILIKPEALRIIPFSLRVPQIDHGICTFCRKCAEACVYNALSIIAPLKKTLFFPELCHACGHCSFVCPEPGAIKEIDRKIGEIRIGSRGKVTFVEGKIDVGVPSGVPMIHELVEQYGQSDGMIIADTSPGTSCPVVESVKKSSLVVLVTEPTPFGLSDLKLTVELVRDLGKNAVIIVNKDNNNRIIDVYAEENGIPVMLKIPYSLDIQRAYSRGIPLIEARPEMKQEFSGFLQKITDQNE